MESTTIVMVKSMKDSPMSSTDLTLIIDSNCDGIDGTIATSLFVALDGSDDNSGLLLINRSRRWAKPQLLLYGPSAPRSWLNRGPTT